MDKLRRYLLANLSLLFFSIFLPLFAIASVIFMIKLATYTAVIQLSLAEMGKLYLFVLPELLFYTLPIAFVISGALALYRLSNDNEMVVIFSLGVPPRFIARILAAPALLLSLFLLVNYLLITPYINSINKQFLNAKQREAKFNLKAAEFGLSFGEWMLFINKSDNEARTYGDLVLFSKEMKDEIVIAAKAAELINDGGVLQFRLDEGKSYIYNDQSFKQMAFKTAYINNMLDGDTVEYRGAVDYWTSEEKRERKNELLITNTLISLFPLLSLFLMIALGVVHARHQKRWIYLWLFLSVIGFYASAIITQQWLAFHAIWAVSLGWLVITYAFYARLVGRRF